MSASNATRFLSNESGSDPRSLALKMYWGTVVTSFRDSTKLFNDEMSVIAKKTLGPGGGKSWQHLILAESPESQYHVPGTEMLGQSFAFDEGIITIDDMIVKHDDIPCTDEMIAHFDVIGPVARQHGEKIAQDMEKRLHALAVLGARQPARFKNGLRVHNGGNRVVNSGSSAVAATAVANRYPVSAVGAQNFRADAANLAQQLDDDFVPEGGRYMLISPYIRRVLGMDPTIYDVQYSPNTPNRLNSRIIGELEGFALMPETNLPGYSNGHTGIDSTTNTGIPAKYRGVFNTTAGNTIPVATVFCGAGQGRAGIGMVIGQGLAPHLSKDERRETWFAKTTLFIGADVMHPFCLGAIEVSG